MILYLYIDDGGDARKEGAMQTLAEFLKEEKKVIKVLGVNGFLNPKADDDLAKTTEFQATVKGMDHDARRFMMKFEYRDPGTLTTNQVREDEADEEWCENTLIPRIKKYGGLQFPIFITQSGEVVHGHNRLWAWKKILNDDPDSLKTKDIPTIVVSDSFLVDFKNMKLGAQFVGKEQAFNNKYSQIICNAPAKNNEYTMKGAALHVRELYILDPEIGGRNPSGEPFYNPDDEKNADDIKRFDKIMDWLHEDRFLDAGVRTKIRKMTINKGGVKKTLTFDDKTSEMVNAFGSSGVKLSKNKKSKSRLQIGEWRDQSNNLVTIIGTAGDKEWSKVSPEIFKAYLDNTLSNIPGVMLGVELGGPQLSADPDTNDKARKKYLVTRLGTMNKLLASKNFPLIKKVRFFVQLTDPRDTGLDAEWDSVKSAFVDPVTKKEILSV